MAWRSGEMAAPRVAPLAALLAALFVSATSRVPTQDPVLFEAAFQGKNFGILEAAFQENSFNSLPECSVLPRLLDTCDSHFCQASVTTFVITENINAYVLHFYHEPPQYYTNQKS